MLQRDPADLPQHSVYVCGFPCTPFSLLRRHSTKLLREPAAKPFRATVKTIKTRLPPVAVLENVRGIRRVMNPVVSHFVKLRWYYVFVIAIDSAELGEPVKRPRYYFVLVRRDVAVIKDRQKLAAFAKALLMAARAPRADTISDRMLPATHPVVRGYLASRVSASRRGVSASRRGASRGATPKWMTRCTSFQRSEGISGVDIGMSARSDMKGLTVPRTHAQWNLLAGVHPSPNLVVELSQNVHRASVCVDGSCPTITPNGIMAVKKAGRIMVPVEKLLAHNFPLHKMPVPTDMTDKEVESLGGNTMHLTSVGLALLIGMAGVDWSASAAQVGRQPAGNAPRTEPAIYINTSAPRSTGSGSKRRMPQSAARPSKAKRRSN